MDPQESLFYSPYDDSVSIPVTRERNTDSNDIHRESDLEEILDNAPERWENAVKGFHTDFRQMSRTISTRSVCNKLAETNYCRSILATVPSVAIKQLQRILRGTADCSSSALIKAFAGHAEDQFWLSPDNPGWSLQALKNTGLVFPASFVQSETEMFVPADLRGTVEEVLEDPPDSNHDFPVPESERVRLRVPEKSYFRDLEEQIATIREQLLAGGSIQLGDDIFTNFLNDPFKMLLLFVGILGDERTAFRSLKEPFGRFVRKLVSHQDSSNLADLLTDVMFVVPGDLHFIVGKDSNDELYYKLWNTLAETCFGSENASHSAFCLGEFRSVLLNSNYLYSFQQRFSLLVPLILAVSPQPVERAHDWMHEEDESNAVVNESLPSGILRWLEQGPHELDREQSLALLQEATDHRRSGIRRTAYRVMRDQYPEKFQALLPEARGDEAKKVREWAEKQNQQQLL